MTLPLPLLRIALLPFARLAELTTGESAALARRIAALGEELDRTTPELEDALFAAAGQKAPDSGAAAAQARLAVVALRRDVHNRRLPPAATLERASPKLGEPLAARLAWYGEKVDEIHRLEEELPEMFVRELSAARRELVSQCREPATAAAIRLAGRPLWASLDRLATLDPDGWRHDERLAAASLAGYLARAATKTSPNGLFAATALARWGEEGAPAGCEGENRPGRLDVLLNVFEARKVAAVAGADPTLWPVLPARPNPTLRQADDGWTFWRPASLGRDDSDEIRRRLARQPLVELLLELAAGPEPPTVTELLAAAGESTGVPAADLAAFFGRLQEAGLFPREVEIRYTERRPLLWLARQARQAEAPAPRWVPGAEAAEAAVDRLPETPLEDWPEALDEVAGQVSALPHVRPIVTDELARVDAASAIEATLPAGLVAELQPALSGYVRMFAALYPRSTLRRAAARTFLEQHGEDHEVPLLDLYGGGTGRGLGPRERPVGFPDPPTAEGRGAFERIQAFFAGRARWAAERGEAEVALSAADFDHLAGDALEPPWLAGVLCQVAAADAGALARGDYLLAINDLFTGAGLSLARFAHLHGEPVAGELGRFAAPLLAESEPGAILAEITFNHWGRTANAGLRRPWLDHEIELLGERASPRATVIPLAELTLRWDASRDRLVLTWHRHDGAAREVVPVISSGVSPEGLVALLVAVGRQAIQPLSYVPGFEVDGITCWPRFTHGRVVLFRRRWVLPAGEAPRPPSETGDPDLLLGRFFAAMQEARRRHALPRHVFVHTRRQPKPFYADLDAPLSADMLRRLVAGTDGEDALIVTEMLPGPGELWARDGRGHYAAELLLQMRGPAG